MSLRDDVLVALADRLADAEVGEWNPTGIYGAQDTAILVAVMPPNPTNVITLSLYALQDQGNDASDSTWGLQVRCRSGQDPRLVQDLADAVFTSLHDATTIPYGDGGVILLVRRSYSAPLNADDENRWVLSDTYQLWLHRPGN